MVSSTERRYAMKIVEVAAGLICREGRYLIARRKAGVHLAGFWEFPGGKREAGETLEECLQRELFEELNIHIDVPLPFQIIRHQYPEKTVELHFFLFVELRAEMPQRWTARRFDGSGRTTWMPSSFPRQTVRLLRHYNVRLWDRNYESRSGH